MQRPTASLLIQSDVGQFKNRGSMKKKNIGNLTLIILVVLTALIWLIFPPVREGSTRLAGDRADVFFVVHFHTPEMGRAFLRRAG